MSTLAIFEEKQVRRIWNQAEEKWYFAIVDVIAILTGSVDAGAYWRKLKERLKKEGNETVTNCHALKMTAADGKQRFTDVADAEQLLRLIQSIPSPKAEPFKLWLAKVGYERLEEIENPELAAKRMRQLYEQKGYSEDWIEKRLRGIAVRDELTDEWKKRGVKEQKEFAILTAEISKATFGMTPSEYRAHKSLINPKDNLRDHMTDLELRSGTHLHDVGRGLHRRIRKIMKYYAQKTFASGYSVATLCVALTHRASTEPRSKVRGSIGQGITVLHSSQCFNGAAAVRTRILDSDNEIPLLDGKQVKKNCTYLNWPLPCDNETGNEIFRRGESMDSKTGKSVCLLGSARHRRRRCRQRHTSALSSRNPLS